MTITTRVHAGASFDRELADRLGVADVHLTIPVGPARANRKPIVQVCDKSGVVLAFVKVGHNDLTRALVRAEAANIAAIADSRNGDGVALPTVRDRFNWHGSEAIVLSPLDVPSRRLSGSPARSRLLRLVSDVAGLCETPRECAWTAHPLRRRLLEGFNSLGQCGEPYAAIVQILDRDYAVVTGAWHGDLNSGNLALISGPCPVWDWERFECDAPLGFDLAHHDLQEWITVDQIPPVAAADRLISRAPQILSGLVSAGSARFVAMTYLLTLAERYLRDDQQNAGAPLGSVGAWILPALRRGVEDGRRDGWKWPT